MDFISFLDDNDHKVFAALCHVYARQIENAMAKQVDEARDYSASCREAPKTKLRLHVPHQSLSEIEFIVQAAGKKFELVGRCEREGLSSDRPCLSLRGHDYHYRPEHSRLLRQRDFDENRNYPDEAAYQAALVAFERQRKQEARMLNQWWDHLQQSEMISRLQVV